MSIKSSLTKLESMVGGQSTKHYLWVRAAYDESKQAAIARHLRQRGITPDVVGYLSIWVDGLCESVDYKNYSRKEDLIGYHDAMRDLREWLDQHSGKTLGPPSERPGYQESVRMTSRSTSSTET